MDDLIHMKFTLSEQATILAGLDVLCRAIKESSLTEMEREVLNDGGTVSLLTVDQIEDLADRINGGNDETPEAA